MGCWDIYCFICGNPCHSCFEDIEKEFIDNLNYYEKLKNKNNEYYKIYQKYTKDKNILQKIKKLKNITKWMNNCIFLTNTNNIILNVKEINCNNTFTDNNNNNYIHQISLKKFNNTKYINEIYGVFIHNDCYKFIYKNYNIKLKYGDLPILDIDNYNKIFDFIDYDEIEKYWNQYFNFIDVVIDSKEYLLNSPLNNDKNTKIIKKNFNKLQIRKHRPSPLTSATFYKNNIYKIGNNNNIWKVKLSKWIEIKTKTFYKEYTLKQYKTLINKLKFVGEINKEPLFVKNIKINNNNVIIEYICEDTN